MAAAALDDVFIDDISFPAADGYLLGASLFLPRGAKRHAVLINSATAAPRKIYRGFAGYLAGRGCAVLTYDYRGIGDSRQKAVVGYNQPRSLVGFKASMSDWAALDVTGAVAWMRERYNTLPLSYVGHSFGGQALGLLDNNSEVSRALLIAAQAAYWKLMAFPERYRVYALLRFVGVPLTRLLDYAPGWGGIAEDLPRNVFLQWVSWVMRKRYLFDDPELDGVRNFSQFHGAMRALVMSDDPLGNAALGRPALFGIYLDHARDRHRHAGGSRRRQDRSFRILPRRKPRHAVAKCCGLDSVRAIGLPIINCKICCQESAPLTSPEMWPTAIVSICFREASCCRSMEYLSL